MKKALLFLCLSLLIGKINTVKAQCYGVVKLDQAIETSSSSFSVSTTFADELILISYDGWGYPVLGNGPITVDGNPATQIVRAYLLPPPISNNTGLASVWAYSAPLAGVHNIVCTETNFTPPYFINAAATFYCQNGSTPLTVASLTTSLDTIPCSNGGPISASITTTRANSMIYCNAEYNEVTSTSYSISFTGATFLDDIHLGNGIEAAQGYASECAPNTYTITSDNNLNRNVSSWCGGLTITLVDIPPTLATNCFTATATPVNPTCGNNNGQISISVVGGSAPYTYTWTPPVSTASSASNLSAGTYTIIVKDASCEDTTIVVTLTTAGPQGIANMTLGEKCFGDCSATATETITGGVPPYTYNWAPGGQTTSSVTGLCAQAYTFTATDNNGCAGTATVTVTQPAALTVTDVATNALCNGGTGSITATPAGGTVPYTYLWSPSAQTGAMATGLSAGSYTTTVTDSNGCSTTVLGVINQPAALKASITGSLTECAGETDTLTANVSGGTAPYTYTWSNSATTSSVEIIVNTTQTITVSVTDANGCPATATFTVSLATPSVMTLSATRTSVCQGSSTILKASATNTTGAFTWQPGSMSGPVISVTPTVITTYTVSVPTKCGLSTATITVNVNQLPATSFRADNITGCSPFCVQFRDKSTSGSGSIASWYWNFGNGDTSNMKNPIYCYPNPGNYPVDLTTVSDSGCSSTLKVLNYITVYSHPNASFTMSPQPATILEPTIQFTDNSTDVYGLAYWIWNFGLAGNDTLSDLQNPSYSYWDTGTYCPSEVVMNIHGCTDTVTNCLVINPVFSLFIPDAFTPNGDGVNDVFMAMGKDVKTFEMYIFDRWGMQLFHTTDINIGWDGRVKGGNNVSQEDTYVYLVTAYDNKNQKHSYLGKVNLIR